MNTEYQILIVEDDAAVARGLEYGLKHEGFGVMIANNGHTALEIIRQTQVHLILLDIGLPDMTGFEVCRKLRAEGKRQPVLMLTARDDEIDKVLGLELGADDYILKPYSLRELISRIRASLRRAYGELAQGSEINEELRFGDVVMDVTSMTVRRAGEEVILTPIEFRLLRYLVSNPRRPITRNTLIEAVWGYTSEIEDDRTIDVHIRHLREKLETDPSTPQWLLTVRGIGYKFEP
jgi:DNA-binding response OmpR family regulator